MAKLFKNEPLQRYNGKPMEMADGDGKTKPAFLKNVLWVFLNNAPMRTTNDTIQGVRLAQALDKCADDEGEIEIEEGVHDWIKQHLDNVLPPLFRIEAPGITELIKEGFEKPNAPKGE